MHARTSLGIITIGTGLVCSILNSSTNTTKDGNFIREFYLYNFGWRFKCSKGKKYLSISWPNNDEIADE
jgi:hypothetical protein